MTEARKTPALEVLDATLGPKGEVGRRLLDGARLVAESGRVVGLIGPNGAGKTTLLRAALRLQPLDRGRVRLAGRDITSEGPHRHARDIAYLPQGQVVHWPLDVARLVALGRVPHASPWGRSGARDRELVAAALQATDVFHLRDRPVLSLSGGERARVLLARALATDAPVLLADEPVAALDPYHELAVMDLFRAAAADGKAVVVVMHDLALAARYCDRLVLMHDGRTVAEGASDDVLSDDNLARVYRVRGGRHGGHLHIASRIDDGPGTGAAR